MRTADWTAHEPLPKEGKCPQMSFCHSGPIKAYLVPFRCVIAKTLWGEFAVARTVIVSFFSWGHVAPSATL